MTKTYNLFNNFGKLEWLLLLTIFLVTGAIGHDHWWKRGEAYTFGIIYHFYTTHTWLIPFDAGEPFMEKPPLYYWTANLLCKLLGGILPLHDAARLASVLYLAIAAYFTSKSSDTLYKMHAECKTIGFITFALFLGTYGIIKLGHAMTTDVSLLAGTAISLYGISLLCVMPEQWKKAGMWLGLGIGISFLSKGFVMPVILAISGIFLGIVSPQLRNKTTIHAVALAFLIASPFLFIWPTLVYLQDPGLFKEWFWYNNIGRFFGFSVARLGAENDRLHLLMLLPLFTLPVLPLACLQVIKNRNQLYKMEYLLPLTVFITGLVILLMSASGRGPYLLPLIPSLAILGAPALLHIRHIRPVILAGWNHFIRIAFSIAAMGTWLIWWSLLHPGQNSLIAWLPALFDKILPPHFIPSYSQWVACLVSMLAALLWISSFRLEVRSAKNTAQIWFTGAALIWCTTHSLLMPWFNETRSFRTVLMNLTDFIQHSPHAHECVGNYNLGENVAPMMQYFTQKQVPLIHQDFNGTACPLILTFADKHRENDRDTRWKLIWKGSEFLDLKGMEVRLYARKNGI